MRLSPYANPESRETDRDADIMPLRTKGTIDPPAYVAAGSALLLLQLVVFLILPSRHVKSVPGLLCMFFGVALWTLAAIHMKVYGSRTGRDYMVSETLVVRGVYSLIRHPQYLSFVLYSGGIAMIIPLTLFLFVSAAILFYLASRAEDRELKYRFGDLFTSYCKHAGAFGRPLLRRRRRRDKKN